MPTPASQATLYRANGTSVAIMPANGTHFALAELQALVGGYVEELNSRLNRWETIKKWELLDHDLSVESGELTPSMKVKRNVVEDNYKEKIDAFYA